jgi:hypothetical protein
MPLDTADIHKDASWKAAWQYGIFIALSRVLVALILIKLTANIIPNGPFGGGTTLLERFAHWDSGWLIKIAGHGYRSMKSSAFYPGMPLLMLAMSKVSFGLLSFQNAGIVLAWVCFLGSSVVLFQIVNSRFGFESAIFSTVLFAFWSGSVFFVSVYAEPVVVLLTLVAALFVQNRRFWMASVIAALASVVAPVGAVFGIAIFVAAYVEKKNLIRSIIYLIVSETGALAYAVFLWIKFNNPFENLASQKLWYRHLVFPFSYLIRNTVLLISKPVRLSLGPLPPGNGNLVTTWAIDDISGIVALAVLIGIIFIFVRKREEIGIPLDWFTFFVLSLLLINSSAISFGSTPSSEAVARLVGSVFPLYPFAYLVLRRIKFLLIPLAVTIATLGLIGQLLFSLNYWFT